MGREGCHGKMGLQLPGCACEFPAVIGVGSPEIWEQRGAGRGMWAARAVRELERGGDSRAWGDREAQNGRRGWRESGRLLGEGDVSKVLDVEGLLC